MFFILQDNNLILKVFPNQSEKKERIHFLKRMLRHLATYHYVGGIIYNRFPKIASFLHRLRLMSKPESKPFPEFYNVYRKEYSKDWEISWEITKRIILELDETIRKDGANLFIIIIPQICQIHQEPWISEIERRWNADTDDFDLSKPNRILTAFLKENDIPHIDFLPIFEKYYQSKKETPYIRNDGHLNELGHEIVANTLIESIKSEVRYVKKHN